MRESKREREKKTVTRMMESGENIARSPGLADPTRCVCFAEIRQGHDCKFSTRLAVRSHPLVMTLYAWMIAWAKLVGWSVRVCLMDIFNSPLSNLHNSVTGCQIWTFINRVHCIAGYSKCETCWLYGISSHWYR